MPRPPSPKPYTKIASILSHIRYKHLELPSWLRAYYMDKELSGCPGLEREFDSWMKNCRMISGHRAEIRDQMQAGNWDPLLDAVLAKNA